ncbi:MAG TPA: hypothetical protein VN812_22405 [Candidatus Acidoferrales bacterium]|nr:hypothetical protein [Candidatus Acidoferrales bacterium]
MKTVSVRITIGEDRQLTIALPDDVAPGPADVVVIVNPVQSVDLAAHGWTQAEAADTRARLKSFDADWEAPGMDAYDAL